MTHDVFICFSSQDQEIADAVCAKLESEGVRCWISSRDMGAGWFTQKLLDAVNQSRILVLVFSSGSNSSEYCINEVHAAFQQKLMIIPFVIDSTTPSGDMEFYLQRFQRLDAQTPPMEKHLQRLANDIKTILSQLNAREEAAAREKERREAEAKSRKEAEETKKAQEIARAKKEVEEASKEKAEAEEAKKAREAEEAKKARESIKEKELREAEIARARKEAEEAKKDREAALKAHKEAEEAKKDREREEAQAAKARKEAEDARKSREAAIKARKEAEEAEESRRAKEAAREQREAEKARRALEPKKAGKAMTAWILVVIGLIIIAAVGITLRYTVFNSDSGITKQPHNTET